MMTFLASPRCPGCCARCGDTYHDHLVTGSTPRLCRDDAGQPLRRVTLRRRIVSWIRMSIRH